MNKTVIAQFDFEGSAGPVAALLNVGNKDGATFTVEFDPSTCRYAICRNEAVAETPFTIEDFVAAMQAKSDTYHEAKFANLVPPTFGFDAGNKYFKVWVVSYGQKSVHCFVEKSTGHVFKANGWKAPAKGVRYPTMQAAVEAFNGSGTGYLYA